MNEVVVSRYFIVGFMMLLFVIVTWLLVIANEIKRLEFVSALRRTILNALDWSPSGWDVCPRYISDSSG